MSLQLSVPARNAMLDSLEGAVGASPKLRILTGALEASCATAEAGTLLCQQTLPSDWMSAASAGTKALLGSWTGTGAAVGLANHFRITDAAGTTCHMQGLVAQNWVASTAWQLNHQVVNGGNVYKCTTAGTSAGSGGPTGTGSGISDGTAVWAYVGTSCLVMDNTSIAVAQAVNTTGFTLTAPNP